MYCKSCRRYVASDREQTGLCALFGDKDLIAVNATVIDSTEDDLLPCHAEVGENFGCVHYETK